jgi:hypothetical protein
MIMINNSTNNVFQYDVVEVTDTTFNLLNDTMHIIKTEDIVQLTLPAVSRPGQTFMIAKMTAYDIQILPNLNQKIYYMSSTTGVAASSSTGLSIIDAAEIARLYRLFRFLYLEEIYGAFFYCCNQCRSFGTGYPLKAI